MEQLKRLEPQKEDNSGDKESTAELSSDAFAYTILFFLNLVGKVLLTEEVIPNSIWIVMVWILLL